MSLVEPGFETATARVDQWVADARAKAERYQAMREQAQQVSVTASAPDELVTVTVDSAGNVTGLRITDEARNLSGERIAAAVLDTIRRAQARLPQRLAEVMADTIGSDQRTIDTIVGNYRAKFPDPDGLPDAPPDDDDDGWADQPVIRGR
jgi:DNA-binding protein YbaB